MNILYICIAVIVAIVFNIAIRVMVKNAFENTSEKMVLAVLSCVYGAGWLAFIPISLVIFIIYWLSKKSELLVESLRYRFHPEGREDR